MKHDFTMAPCFVIINLKPQQQYFLTFLCGYSSTHTVKSLRLFCSLIGIKSLALQSVLVPKRKTNPVYRPTEIFFCSSFIVWLVLSHPLFLAHVLWSVSDLQNEIWQWFWQQPCQREFMSSVRKCSEEKKMSLNHSIFKYVILMIKPISSSQEVSLSEAHKEWHCLKFKRQQQCVTG